jgi:hypothetical protein
MMKVNGDGNSTLINGIGKLLTIKDILDSLDSKNKRKLYYAFEHSLSQYVNYHNGKFIGVNVTRNQSLNIEQTIGVWSIGTIKELITSQ